eukprot:gb/GEZN01007745.1/.p1 GENE.gb/GEZN01007745.1/~~gb/GEZN01007745.1/.p1  ORF type:complete len:290 (+),score=49.41 gb/GEZN01007745.1/:30-899(+)
MSRPGAAASRLLFSQTDLQVWSAVLASYESVVKAVQHAGTKRLKTLSKDDVWVRTEFGPACLKRGHFTQEDLIRIMRWKITRGTFRPLMGLVESNSGKSVYEASSEALRLANASNSQEALLSALNRLCALRGIGPATASAILAMLFPSRCAFMSDEALEGVGLERLYTAKSVSALWSALGKKSKEVGLQPEELGRALWTQAKLAVFPALNSQASAAKTKAADMKALPVKPATSAKAKEASGLAGRAGNCKQQSTKGRTTAATIGQEDDDYSCNKLSGRGPGRPAKKQKV